MAAHAAGSGVGSFKSWEADAKDAMPAPFSHSHGTGRHSGAVCGDADGFQDRAAFPGPALLPLPCALDFGELDAPFGVSQGPLVPMASDLQAV